VESGGVWTRNDGVTIAPGVRPTDSPENDTQIFLGALLPLACGHNKNFLEPEKEFLTMQVTSAFPGYKYNSPAKS
jgi:hypothetical protein